MLNLRSRDIEAQVHGKKRPLYEGRLLDRDIHIADFEVPFNSMWMGSSLKELNIGKKYGIHISSILRGGLRMNIPDGDYVLFPCDRLQVIGSDEQLANFSHALETDIIQEDLKLENREMKLRQVIISETSPFVGKTLEESGIRSIYGSGFKFMRNFGPGCSFAGNVFYHFAATKERIHFFEKFAFSIQSTDSHWAAELVAAHGKEICINILNIYLHVWC